MKCKTVKGLALLAIVGLGSIATLASAETTTHGRYGKDLALDLTLQPTEGEQVTSTGRIVRVRDDQLPPTEVGGLFLSSVVKRLKADSLPKDSILRPYTFYTVT